MTGKHIILALALSAPLIGRAETVIFEEDFNGDYSKSFPYMYDADRQQPNRSIASLFYSNAAESYMPWWVVRDALDSTDKFMGSHSYYATPETSDDWLISVPVEIPGAGFVLTFDAQSVPVRGLDKLSDISLYVTESQLDPQNMPTMAATHVWERVPYGVDPDNCEGDWTTYSYSLDDFAGKTVYINFVNENFDNDIICIDNVKISRADPVDVTIVDFDPYVVDAVYTPEIAITARNADGIKDWKATLSVGGTVVNSFSGVYIGPGESVTVTAEVPLTIGAPTDLQLAVASGNAVEVIKTMTVTRLAFKPVHRVFFEESTSVHCGNCPIGMYIADELLADPYFSQHVTPVSVHVPGLGFDPMCVQKYYNNLPNISQAPMVWINRSTSADGFNPAYDADFDPTNTSSFVYRLACEIEKPTMIGVDVEASWIIEGNDTTAVECRAIVRPAINMSDAGYRVAFILTENNVGLDANPYWRQENYLSGRPYESRCGGWCDLPAGVINARYHDVARAASEFLGHPNSLPRQMAAGEEYVYTNRIDIPDTYAWSNALNILMQPAVQRHFCEVTAIVIDESTGLVVNSARVPMSEDATHRFTAKDLVASGFSDIITDNSDDESVAEYYDLTGRRVLTPGQGIYIRVSGNKAEKIIK